MIMAIKYHFYIMAKFVFCVNGIANDFDQKVGISFRSLLLDKIGLK